MFSSFMINGIKVISGTSSSSNNRDNQASSAVIMRKDPYSARYCMLFLDFHEIKVPPRIAMNPLIDFLVLRHDVQSVSQNASKLYEELTLKKSH